MSRNTFNSQRAPEWSRTLCQGFLLSVRATATGEPGGGRGGEGLENNAQGDTHRPGLNARRSWRIQFKIRVSPVKGFLVKDRLKR